MRYSVRTIEIVGRANFQGILRRIDFALTIGFDTSAEESGVCFPQSDFGIRFPNHLVS